MGSGYRKGNDVTSYAARRSPEAAEAYAMDMKMSRFQHLPTVIWAVQMDRPFKVDTGHGVATGKKGDYLSMDIDGYQYPCEKTIFERTYRPDVTDCIGDALNLLNKLGYIIRAPSDYVEQATSQDAATPAMRLNLSFAMPKRMIGSFQWGACSSCKHSDDTGGCPIKKDLMDKNQDHGTDALTVENGSIFCIVFESKPAAPAPIATEAEKKEIQVQRSKIPADIQNDDLTVCGSCGGTGSVIIDDMLMNCAGCRGAGIVRKAPAPLKGGDAR